MHIKFLKLQFPSRNWTYDVINILKHATMKIKQKKSITMHKKYDKYLVVIATNYKKRRSLITIIKKNQSDKYEMWWIVQLRIREVIKLWYEF